MLIACILASVGVVVADSMQSVRAAHGHWLNVLEWFFTAAFILECVARLSCVRRPGRYARSFFGLIGERPLRAVSDR